MLFLYLENWLPTQLDPYTRKSCMFLDIAILAGIPVLFFYSLIIALHVVINPDFPIYLTSWLPREWLSFYVILPMALFHFSVVIGVCVATMLHIQIILTFVLFVTPIFWQDLRANSTSYRTHAALRIKINLVREYRCVEIMHGIAMEFYGPLCP